MRKQVSRCVVASVLLGLSVPAHAAFFSVRTTGVIDSGSDASGVFGTPGRSLAGLAYGLTLSFDTPGDFQFVSQSDATTSGAALGAVTVTVNGVSFTTRLVDSFGSFLEVTPGEVTASNLGDDPAGDFLTITNQFAAASNVFPVSFYRATSYTGTSQDRAANAGSPVSFAISGAANASFSATPDTVATAVPEPATGGLVVIALATAAARRGRRKA